MDTKKTVDLTEDFFKASIVIETPVDTSRAIIPAQRSTEQAIIDEVKFFASTTTAALRSELRNEIDKARAEREAMEKQRAILQAECAAVAQARRLFEDEMRQVSEEIERVRAMQSRRISNYVSGLCAPSRQNRY